MYVGVGGLSIPVRSLSMFQIEGGPRTKSLESSKRNRMDGWIDLFLDPDEKDNRNMF